MSLLAALGQHATPVNLKQLATETRLHPSTAHRILAVMVDHRLVDRIEPGTYRLGIRLLELGNLVKSRISVRQEALPHMQALHEELGETINLSVRHDDEVVYIERTSNNNAMMRVVQIIGARAPLHITAVGKIFLAEDGPGQVRGIRAAHRAAAAHRQHADRPRCPGRGTGEDPPPGLCLRQRGSREGRLLHRRRHLQRRRQARRRALGVGALRPAEPRVGGGGAADRREDFAGDRLPRGTA